MLLSTLGSANGQAPAAVYPGDDHCAAGDQWCADAILQSPLGGITSPLSAWQNRPTYQQVVSFPASRGQDISNLAQGRPVSVSSTQLFYPAGNAVDGSPTSRWASSSSDNQSITVDLGSAKSVSRVLLRWEAAYGLQYRIDVSANNSTWTTVWSTTSGNGGTDNDVFAPVSARYIRMQGVKRATTYGYSLYELEIYGR
ncbi:discoidin domain-containing protein [Catellatospora sp. KI3]|uniref:discoidin domain-containing protein n=1 Tax=Catellatospora sp. KI3 TaxID=3041620 RepID=UPI0032B19502